MPILRMPPWAPDLWLGCLCKARLGPAMTRSIEQNPVHASAVSRASGMLSMASYPMSSKARIAVDRPAPDGPVTKTTFAMLSISAIHISHSRQPVSQPSPAQPFEFKCILFLMAPRLPVDRLPTAPLESVPNVGYRPPLSRANHIPVS